MEIINSNHDMYKEILFFNNFMMCICIFMPFVKYIPNYIVKNNDMINRKINQYTNWNLFIILCNYILVNIFHIDNIFIAKFIALNSFQIFLIYHIFILYDHGLLFEITDKNTKPISGIMMPKYNDIIIRTEYFLINILIHILPAYYYKEYLFGSQQCINEINMSLYTILFKFFWALNVFGNFNVVSIYLPSFKGCIIKLFNIIVIVDFAIGSIIHIYNNQ
jgi:hypothetical protein